MGGEIDNCCVNSYFTDASSWDGLLAVRQGRAAHRTGWGGAVMTSVAFYCLRHTQAEHYSEVTKNTDSELKINFVFSNQCSSAQRFSTANNSAFESDLVCPGSIRNSGNCGSCSVAACIAVNLTYIWLKFSLPPVWFKILVIVYFPTLKVLEEFLRSLEKFLGSLEEFLRILKTSDFEQF